MSSYSHMENLRGFNLTCDYCYYSTAEGHLQQPIRVMDTDLLEGFIAQYMTRSSGIATFSWQGGESLLAGPPYFERVISLQAKYALPHTIDRNALQTNGTLIHEKWAKFFKRYNFLVGISLDGPESIQLKNHLISHHNSRTSHHSFFF